MLRYIFTLSVLSMLILPFELNAQTSNFSKLVLRLGQNHYYQITIDSKEYSTYSSVFKLGRLKRGNHHIVIRRKINGYSYNSRIIYNGQLFIPSSSIVKARINSYREMEVYSITRIRKKHNDNYYYKARLNLSQLKIMLHDASFESDKKLIAKQAISQNSVKAWQIFEIIEQFSFESTRLEIAKFAYQYCIDKQNYFLVNKAFSFSSSIRELNAYLSTQMNKYENKQWEDEYDAYDDEYADF